jgi:hypothetical protein
LLLLLAGHGSFNAHQEAFLSFVFFRALTDLHKAKQMLDEKDAEISKQRQELETLTTNKGYVQGCGGRTFLYMSLSASWGRCKI